MTQSILALDYGMKRIGAAATDALGYSVQPLPVIDNTGPEPVLVRIVELVESQRIELVIVGLPLNMNDSEGPMALKVRAFSETLQARLPESVEVILRDERLTSWTAEKEEFAKGRLPWKDKGKIDTRAAMILLEDYLNESDPQRHIMTEEAPVSLPVEKSRRRDKFERGKGRRRRR
ncbi:MAG: Holliday junction resolvase RuvX [Planctomycetota bacterium]|nr:Holliday junction resolvase RuvX [Planctomycetota bacterium]